MPKFLGQLDTRALSTGAALRSVASSKLASSLKSPTDSGRGYDLGPSERSAEDEARRQQQFETAGSAIDAALRQEAERQAAEQAAAAAEAEKPFYLKKYGPLPVWGWGVGGASVLLVGAFFLWRRS
jgi:hypothetical protein